MSYIELIGIPWDFGIRLILAAVMGGIIGYERESHSKEAGLKTHILVAVGAALIMIVSQYGFYEVIQQYINVDPSRIAAQVVSGIGFLGAGIIFKENNSIKGLSTAAGIWCVAGIGLATGAGLYILSIVATILILIVFEILSKVSKKFPNKHIEMQIISKGMHHLDLKKILESKSASVISFRVEKLEFGKKKVNFKFKLKTEEEVVKVIEVIDNIEEIDLDFFEVF